MKRGMKQRKSKEQQVMKVHKHIDQHNVYNINNNDYPILLPYPPPPSHTGSQCVSIFGNDICSPRGDC